MQLRCRTERCSGQAPASPSSTAENMTLVSAAERLRYPYFEYLQKLSKKVRPTIL
jgi:hypothetical protein